MNKQAKEQDLRIRLGLADVVIHILERETDDPRQAEALALYQKQRDEIKAQLEQISLPAQQSGKPHDIVIGLKPAVLSAKSKPIGG